MTTLLTVKHYKPILGSEGFKLFWIIKIPTWTTFVGCEDVVKEITIDVEKQTFHSITPCNFSKDKYFLFMGEDRFIIDEKERSKVLKFYNYKEGA